MGCNQIGYSCNSPFYVIECNEIFVEFCQEISGTAKALDEQHCLAQAGLFLK
jgi:hypothetical protein